MAVALSSCASAVPSPTPPRASASTATARETAIELLTPTPSPSFSPTPSRVPDPYAAYRDQAMPLIDELFALGQAVTAQCAPRQLAGCRPALQSLLDTSASTTVKFDTWTYPPCMVGFHTVVRATAVGYHNAAIQGLASIDSRGLFDYQPALKSITVEEQTITGTRLFDMPIDCFR